jgi:cytochrome P450
MATANKAGLAATVLIGVVSLATLIIIERYRKRTRKAPPLVRDTFKAFLDNYVEGKHHWFQLKSSRETGPVFRLPIPQLIPTVALVVTDATLARLILEGDNTFEEHDKSFAYRGMKGITLGVNTMVTKRTHHEGWDWSRKAVASSFSNTNLHRLLPALQLQLNFFGIILGAHADQKKTFVDLASWMVCLTMDFLARSMFHADFGSLRKHSVEMGLIQGDDKAVESDGCRLILQLSVAVKEYAMMQAMIPFRKYMFWNDEVRAGLRAAKELQSIGQKVLDNYRAEHSEEELKDDKTIIAHLLRR